MVPAPRWERIKDLFVEAVALAPGPRAAFLEDECAGDLTLRREVESLLASDEEAAGFLTDSAPPGAEAEEEPDPATGCRLGAYRLIERIGQGGMGVVYRAVRDDNQFEQVVAIKLIRRGLDGEGALRRFRTERQILARLQHPAIARLLDGGTTDDGRPYVVIEYVDGRHIDTYADAHGLDTRARLRLFREVCGAVEYAHRNLVVHRDIKPANILVTPDGEPKLLDFGVAKLLDPSANATATLFGPLTPEYASPEQLRGEPVTTASDVYSLGVVLYELLAGCRPYRVSTANPAELHRAVCEQEPARPSTSAAGHALRRALRGDLDEIVLKAMRKEPALRYSSVEQLSEDIARHLQGRPVEAHRHLVRYRWGKFVRRNRLAVASAVAVAASLVAGLVGTSWQARVAREERRRAEVERARAERRFADVRRLANSFMFDFHETIRELPGATRARQLVVERALEYLDSLAPEATGDLELQHELATAYERVGRIQGFGSGANTGDTAGAFRSYGKALVIRRAIAKAQPGDLRALARLASTQRHLANLCSKQGDARAAAQLYRESAALAEDLAIRDPARSGHREQAARALAGLGRELAVQGDLSGALDAYHRGFAAAQQAAALAPRETRSALALAHQALADGLASAGRIAEARAHCEAALGLFRQIARDDPGSASTRREAALAELTMASALRRLGHDREALAHTRPALAAFEALSAADPHNALAVRDVWAALYRVATTPPALLAPGEGVAAGRRLTEIAARLQAQDLASHWAERDLALSHRALGDALARAGRAGEALQSYRAALGHARALAGAKASARDRTEVARALIAFGQAQQAAGRPEPALASYQEAGALLAELGTADPRNADLRVESARAAGGEGEAHLALARAGPDARRHLESGCAALERSLARVHEVQALGPLDARFGPELARAARRRARCVNR